MLGMCFQYAVKTNSIGVSFLIYRKFMYVNAIWESLKEILSLKNSNIISLSGCNLACSWGAEPSRFDSVK